MSRRLEVLVSRAVEVGRAGCCDSIQLAGTGGRFSGSGTNRHPVVLTVSLPSYVLWRAHMSEVVASLCCLLVRIVPPAIVSKLRGILSQLSRAPKILPTAWPPLDGSRLWPPSRLLGPPWWQHCEASPLQHTRWPDSARRGQ